MDRMASTFPNMRALADSDFWLDFHTFDPENIKNLVWKAENGYKLWNSQLNEDCVKAHKEDPHMCIFPWKSEPHFKTPHLTQEFQYDIAQLLENTAWKLRPTEAYRNYAEDFRKFMQERLKNIKGGNSFLFSPACF